MANLEDKIKKWVILDNKNREINDMLKKVRDEKKGTEDDIYKIIENRNMKNISVNISDGRLAFSETKSSTPLTYKFIEKCLLEIIDNEASVERIIEHIKNSRQVGEKQTIKRFYK